MASSSRESGSEVMGRGRGSRGAGARHPVISLESVQVARRASGDRSRRTAMSALRSESRSNTIGDTSVWAAILGQRKVAPMDGAAQLATERALIASVLAHRSRLKVGQLAGNLLAMPCQPLPLVASQLAGNSFDLSLVHFLYSQHSNVIAAPESRTRLPVEPSPCPIPHKPPWHNDHPRCSPTRPGGRRSDCSPCWQGYRGCARNHLGRCHAPAMCRTVSSVQRKS